MNRLYYRKDAIELHVGDALQVMESMSSASVDCVVTSPPHWGLRDYGTAVWIGGNPECRHTLGTTPHQRRTTKKRTSSWLRSSVNKRCRKCGALAHDRQYGLEPTIDDYVDRLRKVSAEVWRLLTPRGTYWLNLRDGFSYHNSGTGSTRKITNEETTSIVRHKSLMGIPWRAALALQHDGWIIRNAMVWHKPNGIPDPASDRFSARYEMVFFLVEQPDYYFDAARALEPLSQSRPEHRKNHRWGQQAAHGPVPVAAAGNREECRRRLVALHTTVAGCALCSVSGRPSAAVYRGGLPGKRPHSRPLLWRWHDGPRRATVGPILPRN